MIEFLIVADLLCLFVVIGWFMQSLKRALRKQRAFAQIERKVNLKRYRSKRFDFYV